jgi:hypothetical protein
MRWFVILILSSVAAILVLAAALTEPPASPPQAAAKSFTGFDRNVYPGDEVMGVLRKSFAFTSYWLSAPPGEKTNSWVGKRAMLEAKGFGFLLLYQGRTSRQRTKQICVDAGFADAQAAARAARHEGFPEGSVIFLDVEEGGRFSDEYHAYLRSWAESLKNEKFRPGIYCSGIVVDEAGGEKIISADDIAEHIGVKDVAYWVFNDACPPSPGCSVVGEPPAPSASGVAYASVWQYVRSPREKKVARLCRGYASDEKCYAPVDAKHQWFLDMNLATSADPSAAR